MAASRVPRKHLAGSLGHQTLCNVAPRRWAGSELVATKHAVVDLDVFKNLQRGEQCGRCRGMCEQENTDVIR